MMLRFALPFLFIGLSACTALPPPDDVPSVALPMTAVQVEDLDLSHHFGDLVATFVLLDPQRGRMVRHNPERAQTRFLPASTFKIPNTLIALETGAAAGPDFVLTRAPAIKPKPWWPDAWRQRSHTLASALQNSVVWYYEEIARRIGEARMQAFVDQLDYGNRDISGAMDHFRLSGALRISAAEQVDFLKRFYFGELGLSERTTSITRQLLVLEETANYRLAGKTGWAGFGEEGEQVGWFVGYLERGNQVYFFATNVQIEKPEDAARRIPATREILREMGILVD